MEINQTLEDKELTVIPEGRLDSSTSIEFSDYLKVNWLPEMHKLVLDFSAVDYISSMGLRVLVSVYKQLGDREMYVVNANPAVREIFRLSGLMSVFHMQ